MAFLIGSIKTLWSTNSWPLILTAAILLWLFFLLMAAFSCKGCELRLPSSSEGIKWHLKNSPLKSWLLPTSNLVAGWQTKLSYESQFFPILAKYRSCLLPKNPPMSPNFIELNSLEHQVSCSECILDLIFDWGPRVCRIKGLWVIVSYKEESFSAPVMGGKFFAAGYQIARLSLS